MKRKKSNKPVKLTSRDRIWNILNQRQQALYRRYSSLTGFIPEAVKNARSPELGFARQESIKEMLTGVNIELYSVTERLNRMLNDAKLGNKKRIKDIEYFESMMSIGYDINRFGAQTYDKDTQFRMMVLDALRAKGIDIYDPTQLRRALGGKSIEELYEIWKDKVADRDEEGNIKTNAYYEDWHDDIEETLDTLLEIASSTSYKNYKKTMAQSLIEVA